MEFLTFITARHSDVLRSTLEHLHLTGVSVMLAIVVGVPLGVLLTRNRRISQWVLGTISIIQTIPSLALLGFLLPMPLIGGIGAKPAIVALFLYSLLAIVRNTYTGIDQVDPAIREAGRGMGMTDRQILFMVELPLSLPTIMAGIRISTVVCVGIATLCAAIGAGGTRSIHLPGNRHGQQFDDPGGCSARGNSRHYARPDFCLAGTFHVARKKGVDYVRL